MLRPPVLMNSGAFLREQSPKRRPDGGPIKPPRLITDAPDR